MTTMKNRAVTIVALTTVLSAFALGSTFGQSNVSVFATDQTVIASGLTFPTAMTFGPAGALYVSNNGFGYPPDGEGQILKIAVPQH